MRIRRTTTFRSRIVIGLLAIFSVSSLVGEIMSFRGHPSAVRSVGIVGLVIAAAISLLVIGLLLREVGTRSERFVLVLLAFEVVRKIVTLLLTAKPFVGLSHPLVRASGVIGIIDAIVLTLFALVFSLSRRDSTTLGKGSY